MPVNEKLIIELQANVDKYKKEIASAGKVTADTQKGIETSLNKITDAIRNQKDPLEKGGKGFKGFGRNAGQAGIQLQQFMGQLQGGQSFMLAFGQQAADLGIVLGAPLLGAIAGITAAVSSMAISFFSAGKDTNELIDRIRELKDEGKATAAQLGLIAREDEKASREKRKRIDEIDGEIKSTEGLLAQYRSLEEDIGRLSDAELLRVKSIPELVEKLQNLRAEQDLLNQELDKGNEKSREQLNLEKELAKEFAIRSEANATIISDVDDDPRIQKSKEVTARLLAEEQLRFDEQSALLGDNYLALAQLEIMHEENKTRIKEKGAADRDKIRAQEERKDQVSAIMRLNFARQIFAGLKALGNETIEDNKALNAGLIVADTAAAAMAAVKASGGNPAAAIPTLLFGAAQLAANNSAQKGGGSIGGAGGGVSTQSQAEPDTNTTVEVQDIATSQTQVVRIELDGLDTFIEGVSKKIDEGKANGSL
jgi:hypothetical protein